MNRTRNALIIVGILVVVVVAAAFLSRRGGSSALPVPTQKLTYAAFTVKLPENGTIMHPMTATIPTLVAGNIGHIYVRAGDHVSAGQLLATIENPTIQYTAEGSAADYSNAVANVSTARVNEQNSKVQYQGQVDTQKSAFDEAQRVYDADVALYKQQAIPRSQLDADKAKLDQAKVAYDQAVEQLRLGAVSGYGQNSVQAAQADAQAKQIANQGNQEQVAFLHIVAPSSGIIQTVAANPSDPLRTVQPGDAVTAGQSLFTISQSNQYIAKAEVDEQDVINVRQGQQANITGQDFPNKTIVGHVSDISPVAQKSTDSTSTAKQILTTISLDNSPAYLKDGMTVDVDILTSNIPHALVVNNGAINKDGKKSYVYVIKNGVAHKQYISIGRAGDTNSIVTSGLMVGDVVVSQGAQNLPSLKDGAAVSPMPSPSASPSPSGT